MLSALLLEEHGVEVVEEESEDLSNGNAIGDKSMGLFESTGVVIVVVVGAGTRGWEEEEVVEVDGRWRGGLGAVDVVVAVVAVVVVAEMG